MKLHRFDNTKKFKIIPHQKLVKLSYFTFATIYGSRKAGCRVCTMKRSEDSIQKISLFILLRTGPSTWSDSHLWVLKDTAG